MKPVFDLVTCVGDKDVAKFLTLLPLIRTNIHPDRIFVIAHRTRRETLAREDTHFLDEDTLIPGVTYGRLREWITSIEPRAAGRTGWYFQQFLKMGACYIPSLHDYYLIWDADLAPFRPLTFFDRDGRVLLAPGTHQHQAYFDTLRALLAVEPQAQLSFVSEHLMVKTSVMQELVEKLHGTPGRSWVQNCLQAIRQEDLPRSGFSEYETYGHYLAANHADTYRVRRLKYLRTAGSYMREPRGWFLRGCGYLFDIGAFERWTPSILDRLARGIRSRAKRLAYFTGYRPGWTRSQAR